jgi:anti-sigma B factor antagonist
MITNDGEAGRRSHVDGLTPAPFTADVTVGKTRVVVRLAGELDVATAPQLEQAFAVADGRDVDVDLQALEFIDVRGVGALISAATRCARAGGRVRVQHPRPFVAEVLALCELDEVIAPADRAPSGASEHA